MIRHVRALPLLFIAASALFLSSAASYAANYDFHGINGALSADAVFSTDTHGNLVIDFSNTASSSATSAGTVLTGIFFDYKNDSKSISESDLTNSETTLSVANGSTYVNGQLDNKGRPTLVNGQPVVYSNGQNPTQISQTAGEHWAHLNDVQVYGNAYSLGVSATGLGVFGNQFNDGASETFEEGGANPVLDGGGYGLVNNFDPNDWPNNGGNGPLIQNEIQIVIHGDYDPSAIGNVLFQYGTSLGETHFNANFVPHVPASPVPEPPFIQSAALLLMGGLYAFRQRRGRRPSPPHGEALLV